MQATARPAARRWGWLCVLAVLAGLLVVPGQTARAAAPSSSPFVGSPVAGAGGVGQVSVAAGTHHTCAIQTDRTVACWGDDFSGSTEPPAGTFRQVSAGYLHTCGVRTDGTISCWGYDSFGQVDAPAGTFTDVTAGGNTSCGVRTDGTVVCWGNNAFEQTNAPSGTFTQVAVGSYHACAVKTDGTVACWGDQDFGMATPPGGTFVQVSAAGSTTCGVRTDGTVACWGYDFYGGAAAFTGTFTQVTVGWAHACGMHTDGTVACWGDNDQGKATAPAGTFAQVSVSDAHSCAVKPDNTVTCWGSNNYGQLGARPAVSGSLPNGVAGTPYSASLSAGPAAPRARFAVTDGTLPDGLSLSADGTVSGTPTTTGSTPFTVTASNVLGSDSRAYAVSVNPPATTTNTSLSVNPSSGSPFQNVTISAVVRTGGQQGQGTPLGAGDGVVKFFDNGVQFAQANVGAGGNASTTYSQFGGVGCGLNARHDISAQFVPADPTSFLGSTSLPITTTYTPTDCGYCPPLLNPDGSTAQQNACIDPQAFKVTVPAGSLLITTPYTPANPFDLGTMQFDASNGTLTASKGFPSAGDSLTISDLRPGELGWTAYVNTTDFTTSPANGTPISGNGLAFSGLAANPIGGNALGTAAKPVTVANVATFKAAPAAFANAPVGGSVGSVNVAGTMTLTAPTSTMAGTYFGTVTFTVS